MPILANTTTIKNAIKELESLARYYKDKNDAFVYIKNKPTALSNVIRDVQQNYKAIGDNITALVNFLKDYVNDIEAIENKMSSAKSASFKATTVSGIVGRVYNGLKPTAIDYIRLFDNIQMTNFTDTQVSTEYAERLAGMNVTQEELVRILEKADSTKALTSEEIKILEAFELNALSVDLQMDNVNVETAKAEFDKVKEIQEQFTLLGYDFANIETTLEKQMGMNDAYLLAEHYQKGNYDDRILNTLGISASQLTSMSEERLAELIFEKDKSVGTTFKSLQNLFESTGYDDYASYKEAYDVALANYQEKLAIQNQVREQMKVLPYQLEMRSIDYQNFNAAKSVKKVDMKKAEEFFTYPEGSGGIIVNYSSYCKKYGDVDPYTFLSTMKDQYGAAIDFLNLPDKDLLEKMYKVEQEWPDDQYDDSMKNYYLYAYATQGKDAADQYIKDMKTSLNMQVGELNAKKFLDHLKDVDEDKLGYVTNHLWVTGKGLGTGTVGFFENTGYAFEAFFSGEENRVYSEREYETMYILQGLASQNSKIQSGLIQMGADGKLNNVAKESIIDYSENYGYLLEHNFQISQSIGNMLPAMAASVVNPWVGSAALGISAGGGGYHSAMVEGHSKGSSILYGIASGSSEVLMEKFLGAIPLLSDVNVTSWKTFLQSCVKEGNEEFWQSWVDAGFSSIILKDEFNASETMGEAVQSAAYGAITGGIMNSVSFAMNAKSIHEIEQNVELGNLSKDSVVQMMNQILPSTQGMSYEEIVQEYSRQTNGVVKTMMPTDERSASNHGSTSLLGGLFGMFGFGNKQGSTDGDTAKSGAVGTATNKQGNQESNQELSNRRDQLLRENPGLQELSERADAGLTIEVADTLSDVFTEFRQIEAQLKANLAKGVDLTEVQRMDTDLQNVQTVGEVADVVSEHASIQSKLNVEAFRAIPKAVLGMLDTFPALAAKFKYDAVTSSKAVSNNIVSNGLYHITSLESAQKILQSGFVKASDYISSYGNKKSFFFAGAPTLSDVAVNINSFAEKRIAVKFQVDENSLSDFRYRSLSDLAITHDGDYHFDAHQAEIVYLGLTEENGQFVYKEISQDEYENYQSNVKLGKLAGVADNLKNFAIGMASEYEYAKRRTSQLKSFLSGVHFESVGANVSQNVHSVLASAVDSVSAMVENTGVQQAFSGLTTQLSSLTNIFQKIQDYKNTTSIATLIDQANVQRDPTTVGELKNKIVANMPSGLSAIEKARYLYLELGKVLNFSEAYAKNAMSEEAISLYTKEITDDTVLNNKVVCTIWSQLYQSLLESQGIESVIQSAHHAWVEFKIDNMTFMADATKGSLQDLARIKAHEATEGFLSLADYSILDEDGDVKFTPYDWQGQQTFNSILLEIDQSLGYITDQYNQVLSKIKDQYIEANYDLQEGDLAGKLAKKLEILSLETNMDTAGIIESKSYLLDYIQRSLSAEEKQIVSGTDITRTLKNGQIDVANITSILQSDGSYKYYALHEGIGLQEISSMELDTLFARGFQLPEGKRIAGYEYHPVQGFISSVMQSLFAKIQGQQADIAKVGADVSQAGVSRNSEYNLDRARDEVNAIDIPDAKSVDANTNYSQVYDSVLSKLPQKAQDYIRSVAENCDYYSLKTFMDTLIHGYGSRDGNIRKIVENIDVLGNVLNMGLADAFTFGESAFRNDNQVTGRDDFTIFTEIGNGKEVFAHELGHALWALINNKSIPEDYTNVREAVLANWKANSSDVESFIQEARDYKEKLWDQFIVERTNYFQQHAEDIQSRIQQMVESHLQNHDTSLTQELNEIRNVFGADYEEIVSQVEAQISELVLGKPSQATVESIVADLTGPLSHLYRYKYTNSNFYYICDTDSTMQIYDTVACIIDSLFEGENPYYSTVYDNGFLRSHTKEYFDRNSTNGFDEQFADFMRMKLFDQRVAYQIVEKIFGSEYVEMMEAKVQEIAQSMENGESSYVKKAKNNLLSFNLEDLFNSQTNLDRTKSGIDTLDVQDVSNQLSKYGIDGQTVSSAMEDYGFRRAYVQEILPFIEFVEENASELDGNVNEILAYHINNLLSLRESGHYHEYLEWVQEGYFEPISNFNVKVFDDANFRSLFSVLGKDVFSDKMSQILEKGYSSRLVELSQKFGIDIFNTLNTLPLSFFEDGTYEAILSLSDANIQNFIGEYNDHADLFQQIGNMQTAFDLYQILGREMFGNQIVQIIQDGYSERLLAVASKENIQNIIQLGSEIFRDGVYEHVFSDIKIGENSVLEFYVKHSKFMQNVFQGNYFDGFLYTYENVESARSILENSTQFETSRSLLNYFDMDFIHSIGLDNLNLIYHKGLINEFALSMFQKLVQTENVDLISDMVEKIGIFDFKQFNSSDYQLLQQFVSSRNIQFILESMDCYLNFLTLGHGDFIQFVEAISRADVNSSFIESLKYDNHDLLSSYLLYSQFGFSAQDVKMLPYVLETINSTKFSQEYYKKYGGFIDLLNECINANTDEILNFSKTNSLLNSEQYVELLSKMKDETNQILRYQFAQDLKLSYDKMLEGKEPFTYLSYDGSSIPVYKFSGEDFIMLVHAITNRANTPFLKEANELLDNPSKWYSTNGSFFLSCSLISDFACLAMSNSTSYFNDKSRAVIYGFANVAPELLRIMFLEDGGVNVKGSANMNLSMENTRSKHLHYINTITTIEHFLSEYAKKVMSNHVSSVHMTHLSWNEVTFLRDSKQMRPDYVVHMAHDLKCVRSELLKAAKYFNIPVFWVDDNYYQNKILDSHLTSNTLTSYLKSLNQNGPGAGATDVSRNADYNMNRAKSDREIDYKLMRNVMDKFYPYGVTYRQLESASSHPDFIKWLSGLDVGDDMGDNFRSHVKNLFKLQNNKQYLNYYSWLCSGDDHCLMDGSTIDLDLFADSNVRKLTANGIDILSPEISQMILDGRSQELVDYIDKIEVDDQPFQAVLINADSSIDSELYQLVKRNLQVPAEVITRAEAGNLSLIEYLAYGLDSKYSVSALKSVDQAIIEKFGIEKVKKLDLQLWASLLTYDYSPLIEKFLDIDANTNDLNGAFYDLIKDEIPAGYYSDNMKKVYPNRFFDIDLFTNTNDVEWDFNFDRTKIKDFLTNWNLLRSKDFGYYLHKYNSTYGNAEMQITESQFRAFMNDYHSLIDDPSYRVYLRDEAWIYRLIYEVSNQSDRAQKDRLFNFLGEFGKKVQDSQLTLNDFQAYPFLLDFFSNQNVVSYLADDFDWLADAYKDLENSRLANEQRLKTIEVYQNLSNEKIQKHFQDYIEQNIHQIRFSTIQSFADVCIRLENSNAIELSSFQSEFFNMILGTDHPLEALDKIEQIFLQNNLPFFAKIFSCFQTLYPDLSGKTNFNFRSDSSYAPELLDGNLPKIGRNLTPSETRFAVIFNDLMRIACRSQERSLVEYIDNLEIGNDLYLQAMENGFDLSSNTPQELEVLTTFVRHLETLYNNTQKGKKATIDFSNMSLEEKLKILGDEFQTTSRYDLKDRIVRSFFYLGGIESFQDLKQAVFQSSADLEARTNKVLAEMEENGGIFKLHKGDFIRGIGTYDAFGSSVEKGNVSNEYLGSIRGTSVSDFTPLDVDFSKVMQEGDIYHILANSITKFEYGNIYVVMRGDNPNIHVTRESGLTGIVDGSTYDPSKMEMFSLSSGDHFGGRTGFAFTDIDAILYRENRLIDPAEPYLADGSVNYMASSETLVDDLSILKFELAKKGFYIPIVDFSGKLLFTQEEYQSIRSKMDGLSYFGFSTYSLSENLVTDAILKIARRITPASVFETVEKRGKIVNVVDDVIQKLGYHLNSEHSQDLTSGSIDFIDTGSTGRNSNVPGDGDFDFMMRLDASIMRDSEKLWKVKHALYEQLCQYPHTKAVTTSKGDFRFTDVQLDENTVVDIDISFGPKTDKVSYSSDMSLKDRLHTIQQLFPDQYENVIANILAAKKVLKEAKAYKPKHSGVGEDGLGGVGIENWILQNGGSFLDAARSFVQAAEGKTFAEFQKVYQIWDFGENYFAARDGKYTHDNFVANNMSESGYNKMVEALKAFLDHPDDVITKAMGLMDDGILRNADVNLERAKRDLSEVHAQVSQEEISSKIQSLKQGFVEKVFGLQKDVEAYAGVVGETEGSFVQNLFMKLELDENPSQALQDLEKQIATVYAEYSSLLSKNPGLHDVLSLYDDLNAASTIDSALHFSEVESRVLYLHHLLAELNALKVQATEYVDLLAKHPDLALKLRQDISDTADLFQDTEPLRVTAPLQNTENTLFDSFLGLRNKLLMAGQRLGLQHLKQSMGHVANSVQSMLYQSSYQFFSAVLGIPSNLQQLLTGKVGEATSLIQSDEVRTQFTSLEWKEYYEEAQGQLQQYLVTHPNEAQVYTRYLNHEPFSYMYDLPVIEEILSLQQNVTNYAEGYQNALSKEYKDAVQQYRDLLNHNPYLKTLIQEYQNHPAMTFANEAVESQVKQLAQTVNRIEELTRLVKEAQDFYHIPVSDQLVMDVLQQLVVNSPVFDPNLSIEDRVSYMMSAWKKIDQKHPAKIAQNRFSEDVAKIFGDPTQYILSKIPEMILRVDANDHLMSSIAWYVGLTHHATQNVSFEEVYNHFYEHLTANEIITVNEMLQNPDHPIHHLSDLQKQAIGIYTKAAGPILCAYLRKAKTSFKGKATYDGTNIQRVNQQLNWAFDVWKKTLTKNQVSEEILQKLEAYRSVFTNPDEFVSVMDSLFETFPALEQNITAYRVVDGIYVNGQKVQTYDIGTRFQDDAFLSHQMVVDSFAPEAYQIVLKVEIPKGIKAAYIEEFTGVNAYGQQELLLNRGYTYEITGPFYTDEKGRMVLPVRLVLNEQSLGHEMTQMGLSQLFDGSHTSYFENSLVKNMSDQTDLADVVSYMEEKGLHRIFESSMEELRNLHVYDDIQMAEHGFEHVRDVVFYSLYLGSKLHLSNREMTILLEAAKYHDAGRNGKDHGNSGALAAKAYLRDKYSARDMALIEAAISYHAVDDNLASLGEIAKQYGVLVDDMVSLLNISTVLKDADALDRSRFIDNLDVKYLRLNETKNVIQSSYQMQEIRAENYLNLALEQNRFDESEKKALLDWRSHNVPNYLIYIRLLYKNSWMGKRAYQQILQIYNGGGS